MSGKFLFLIRVQLILCISRMKNKIFIYALVNNELTFIVYLQKPLLLLSYDINESN